MEVQEVEKTKKKKKKVKEDIFKTNILEGTPKVERNFSFANLHSCFSPLIFSSIKKEDREDKPFQPCVLVHNSEAVVSPSKMLSLNSPFPHEQEMNETSMRPISKKLFFHLP